MELCCVSPVLTGACSVNWDHKLEEREINFEAFDIADVCGNKIQARKRSNARCYAFVSEFIE